MKTEQEIRDFCTDHYYCDESDGIREKWEPFEDFEDYKIEELIEEDVVALKGFLKGGVI